MPVIAVADDAQECLQLKVCSPRKADREVALERLIVLQWRYYRH
jgi:hypothetical protein